MLPLFQQVHHGCAADLYDEVYEYILQDKIYNGNQRFLVKILGAWQTALSVVYPFFPYGDLSKIPLVTDRYDLSWLLNEAGLSLLTTGRPNEAEEIFKRKLEINVNEGQLNPASRGYQNLAELQFRTGRLDGALTSAQKALEFAQKSEHNFFIICSRSYLAWIYHLLGKNDEAEKEFEQADELCLQIHENRLYSQGGVFYSDFLLAIGKVNEAVRLTEQNLKICKNNNMINDISECYRSLCAVYRTIGDLEQAADYLHKVLEIARRIGVPNLEIEALLESAELNLALKNPDQAKLDVEQVLTICKRTGFKFYEKQAKEILSKL
jgi:tetratricopeptide (TPR) repeat protein